MSKKFQVTVPFTGSFTVLVEAESEEEAVEQAMERCQDARMVTDDCEEDRVYCNEWQTHRQIVEGNVCYADCWQATVEETNEDF